LLKVNLGNGIEKFHFNLHRACSKRRRREEVEVEKEIIYLIFEDKDSDKN